MGHLNVEFKARCHNPHFIRQILASLNASLKGVDHQIDTYFNTSRGRLKLREGIIENNLIYYERSDTQGSKESHVILFETEPRSILKEMLANSFGVLAIVDKKREIYFVENVKIHIDNVETLGSFVEVEAIDMDGSIGKPKLESQCAHFLDIFKIAQEDLIATSYSDLILNPNIVQKV